HPENDPPRALTLPGQTAVLGHQVRQLTATDVSAPTGLRTRQGAALLPRRGNWGRVLRLQARPNGCRPQGYRAAPDPGLPLPRSLDWLRASLAGFRRLGHPGSGRVSWTTSRSSPPMSCRLRERTIPRWPPITTCSPTPNASS